jgi:hypothetical protein
MRGLTAGLAVVIVAGWLIAAGTSPAAASGGGGGCSPYVNGYVVPVPCSSGTGTGGSGGAGGTGGGGGSVSDACTFVPLDEAQAKNLGLQWPPPKGQSWALLDCIGGQLGPGPQAVLINDATGVPEVTPQELLVRALNELKIPDLKPSTAPPRGRDGLVGLPEWFWVPAANWHPQSVTVTAGPVWATATATPVGLTIDPGAGLSPVSCAGPGTAYDRARPAAAQHTDCSYTYLQPSAGQPGNAYRASITVSWRVSWTGSGGVGGVLDGALPVTLAMTIPVAQGEALVTSP